MSSANILLKQDLTAQEMVLLQTEFDKRKKSKTIAYLLWFFTGGIGGHRFYSGDIKRAIFMLLTLGGLGIWTLIDVFFIGSRIEEKNDSLEVDIIQQIKAYAKKEAVPTV